MANYNLSPSPVDHSKKCYAGSENKALVITHSLEDWSDNLFGMSLRVDTDYNPLASLFSFKLMTNFLSGFSASKCFSRGTALTSFTYLAELCTADALSKSPLAIAKVSENLNCQANRRIRQCYPCQPKRMDKIMALLNKDETSRVCMHDVQKS